MARQSRVLGFDPAQIARSRQELVERTGTIWTVRHVAYKPTGVALGCPLPDARATRRFWRIAQVVDHHLRGLSADGAPEPFAYVPANWYHATLLNYTHFDDCAAGEIRPLGAEDWPDLCQAVAEANAGPISVECSGLVLTRSGRLLVTGFPDSEAVYRLRACVAERLPGLRTHIPATVHFKLGHLLTCPAESDRERLLAHVALCGQHISARLTFSSVHTPLGTIAL